VPAQAQYLAMHSVSTEEVRARLISRQEVALLDVRDEAEFAQAHPLFAASVPLGRLELEILDRVPRATTPVRGWRARRSNA
jgi:rhodanese-related sulfurtransferase